jgi:hypothetical protein
VGQTVWREAPAQRAQRRPKPAPSQSGAPPRAATGAVPVGPDPVEPKTAPQAEVEPEPSKETEPPAQAQAIELAPERAAPEPAAPEPAAPEPEVSRAITQPGAPRAEVPAEPSIPWPAVDLPSPPPAMPVGPPPNVDTLMADAAALIDAGDLFAARNLMLTAVAVHRAAGRPDAALDVCLELLALAPGDAYVHLAIAGLQLDRGWQTLATEKIALLLRLTALTGDTQAEADVHALAAERVRDEPSASVARH